MAVTFPKDFLFGWSQAGFQSEMGTPGSEDPNSDWYAWVHDRENIAAGLVSGDFPENGPGYWGNYRKFHDAAQAMGLTAARIGVEWSRIFPRPTFDVKVDAEVKGDDVLSVYVSESALEQLDKLANKEAINHYREMFSDLRSRGMTFILNLYHWPLPLWLHDPIAVRRGNLSAPSGWLDARTVIEFAKFSAYVAWKLDDLVYMYSTMNEPNVVWGLGYAAVKSGFPPGYLCLECAGRAMRNLVQAHARAYDAVKAITKKPVGVIYANSDFTPLTEADREAAERAKLDNRWAFFDAVVRGQLGGSVREDLKGRLDWIGVNYYTRQVVRARGGGYEIVPGYGHGCEPNGVSPAGRPCSDFGWEFYPEGLYNVLREYWDRYHLPLLVTENGIADEGDYQRPYYLVSHVYQVHRALQDGVNVMGYLHWSLADNYEWASGFSKRFGLLMVDYSTKRLYWRPSAFIYREIAKSKAITDEIEHLNSVPPLRGLSPGHR
ncbi:beta-galactosidase BgaS [Acidilobus sp.]|uniref:beta-galactosidase BgaS n=1 Tax=Acidilobus sp. TaxID=1872109 RepID=UPI003D060296